MSSFTANSVVKLVPLPVTVAAPAVTETVPVLFWYVSLFTCVQLLPFVL
jgi:lipid-A-disaccharide synthase-like uncharacterized protein